MDKVRLGSCRWVSGGIRTEDHLHPLPELDMGLERTAGSTPNCGSAKVLACSDQKLPPPFYDWQLHASCNLLPPGTEHGCQGPDRHFLEMTDPSRLQESGETKSLTREARSPNPATRKARTRTGCWNCRRRRKKCQSFVISNRQSVPAHADFLDQNRQ